MEKLVKRQKEKKKPKGSEQDEKRDSEGRGDKKQTVKLEIPIQSSFLGFLDVTMQILT